MTTGRIEMGPTARTVAANVRRVREARGMSLRALSQELQTIGRTLSADAINKIENGRLEEGEVGPKQVRRADVDDLVALALALNVSPLTLLLPPKASDEPVHLADAVAVTGGTAWSWGEGLRAVPVDDTEEDPAIRQEAYEALALPPDRRRFEKLRAVQSARRLSETIEELTKISPQADNSTTVAARTRAARHHQQLGHELDELLEQLPPAPSGE
ncbi:helix-turn-helix domain-containing protein [Streptomyces fagopyri]|uniref:helix-turn-helix domain-containing protein n=1 Tax=Streptomyces fagopyri TaxID=2662397 RepID=UPI0036BB7B06